MPQVDLESQLAMIQAREAQRRQQQAQAQEAQRAQQTQQGPQTGQTGATAPTANVDASTARQGRPATQVVVRAARYAGHARPTACHRGGDD